MYDIVLNLVTLDQSLCVYQSNITNIKLVKLIVLNLGYSIY